MNLTSSLATICLLVPAPGSLLCASPSSFSSAAAVVPAGPDAKKIAKKLAPDQPAEDRISAAKKLKGLGKKSAAAVPQMILALNDSEPEVVESVTAALRSVGKKAREPLQEVLVSGAYDGQAVAPAPVTKALLGMGKKAATFVRDHMDGMEMGPDKIAFIAALDADGLPYFAKLFGAADGAYDVEMMRTIRTLAAKAPREPDSIAATLKGVKDVPLHMALEVAWLQDPQTTFLSQYTAWLASDSPMLIETGLWTAGLMGKDAAANAEAVVQHLDHSDPLIRATAAWALPSLMTPGPGPEIEDIPASLPSASKSATARVDKFGGAELVRIYENTAKPLGYRGRIGTKARETWGLAPTWTRTTLPVPANPDRSKIPAELLAAEDQLFETARSGRGLDARLASDALAAFGNTQDRCRDLWLEWIATEDVALIKSGLIGLRAIGRPIIMIDPQPEVTYENLVISHLEREETRLAAAQLLTNIMTPTAWSAVVEQMTKIEGTPPLEMIAVISRYDTAALQPYLPMMQDLYEKGNYVFSALIIKFGADGMSSFEKELKAKLMDRRMVAVESLGHVGKDARSVLPRLRSMRDKNPVVQKVINDAIKKIQ